MAIGKDSKMLAAAAVGVVLIQREGGAAVTAANADVLCTSIFDALGLLQNPKRLIATLRAIVFMVIADQIRFD